MHKFLRTLALLVLFCVPWVTQGQNAKVSEYDYSVTTATYSTIVGTSGATAWTAANQTDGYVDIAMPFAMYFGETQIASGSTLRVYGNGSAEFMSLTGSQLAPLYYASGYTTTATSVYTKSTSAMLTVEWRKVVSGSNSYSFQMKLYNTGDIEFCYGPMTLNSSISVLVGMMSSSTDIYRVGGANGTSSWDDITRYTTGTNTRTLSSTYKPSYDAVAGTGMVYTFTQPACVKPNTFTATAASSSAIDLAWTVNDAGVKYEIKYSTNADFDPATEGSSQMVNDANALSASVTGLSANTTYYFALRKYCNANTPSGWIMAQATTDCGPYTAADLPIFENFDSYGTGSSATIHRCWTKTYGYNGSHTNYPYPSSSQNHTADGGNSLYFYASSTASYRSWVAIPYSGPMNNICVNFWILKTSAAYGNIQVGVMSDPDDFSTFELIENAGINTTDYSTYTWYNQEVYFDNYTGNGTYIVLLAPSGASNYAYVDDITISTLPACRRISGLQVNPSGLVSWNAVSGSTYEVKYATSDFDPTIEGTANTVSTNSFQIPNPAGSTTYYVYVRNNCNEYWKKATFTTPLTMPFYEDFTSTTFPPSGWQKLSGLLSDAYSGTNPTSSSSGWTRYTSSYGLDAPHAKLNIYGTSYKYWLVTPNIYINGNADLSFDLALTKYGNSNAVTPGSQADDKFAVLVSTDGGNSWTTSNTLALWDNAGSSYVYDNIPSTGTTVVLPLTAYTGQSIMIAFYGESTVSGGDNDLHIDNISVDIHRSCAKPSDLAATNITGSSATVTWTENSQTSATQWKVKWANHTFTGDDTDVDSAIVNGTAQKILTGLTPGTTYYFMVQSLCDVASGDISAWSNSGNFTTSFGVPFYEDFTSTTFPPASWSKLTGLLSNAFDGTNPTSGGSWSRATTSYGLTTQPFARGNIYGTSWKHWLVTPSISIDVNAALEFDIALTGYSSSGNSAAQAAPDDRFVVLVSTDNGATWSQSNVIREWNNTGSQYVYDNISRYGEHVIIPLTAYQGQSVKIAFYGESTQSNGDNYFYIDNVTIQQIVSCYPVTNVATSNVTASSVDLSWNDNNGTPDSWTIIYGAPGFNPATEGTNVTAYTNPFTLSGLTPQTSYDVYVRANCVTGSDVSALSSVYTFATTCTNPCYDSIFMTDNYGDGWEGHTIDLYVNGNLSAQYTLASGSEGSAIVQMCPGDQVQFRWSQNGGNLYGENNFEIYNHDNELIYSCTAEAGLSNGIVLWTGRACFTPNCHVPNALTASVTYTTATIDWTETTTPAPTQWVLAYQGENDVDPTYVAINTKPYTITGLTANTNYTFAVRAVCEPGVDSSDWSNAAYFYTGYCQPAPTSVDNSGMTNVVFGDNLVVNTDTTEGLTYADLSNLIGDAGQGTTAEVQITYATNYTYNSYIWVDWNNDLDFDDEGELVYEGESLNDNPTTLSANFTVPATVALGDYRMRVGGGDNPIVPCYTGSYACLFDFTLRVTPAPTCYKPTALAATTVYGKQVILTWTENTPTPATMWQIAYNNNETNTLYQIATTKPYTLNGLVPETEYSVMVRAICGAGDTSNWSAPVIFTTMPSCWAPSDLDGTATANSATLTWTENTLPTAATRWEVAYGANGFDPDDENQATYVETTNRTNFEINELRHSSSYQFYVRALCGEDGYSDWSNVLTLETQCGAWSYADMPLVENFDGVTGTTSSTVSVLPNSCWSKINTGTSYYGRPQVYSGSTYAASGTNSMYFYVGTGTSYANNYAILPEMGFDLDTIAIELSARFGNSTSEITIGVMSDPEDVETFVPVTTIHAPSSGYNTHATYTADLQEYTGNARYIAIAALKGSSTNYFYIDDLQVKLREKVNTLPNNGATLAICNEVVIPDTVNANYGNNINATYVINPDETGKVVHLTGTYDLENGYDFLRVYEGVGSGRTLVGTYTGTGSIDFMTTNSDWANHGSVTLVFTTDADNSFAYTGFKLLAQCECPQPVADTVYSVVEANGTYTWINGETYTNNSTTANADDLIRSVFYAQPNVGGCDSVYYVLDLTVHPTYELNYAATICEHDTFEFYGQTFTTAGTHTVTLQSVYGADSTGRLALTVNSAPSAFIQYNNRTVTAVADMCDNFDMSLNARSNVATATFLWEDSSTAALRVVNPHESNIYTVVAINPATGCTSLPAQVTVTTTPVPALTITGDSAICYGQSTTLTLADANSVPATYRWSTNATTESITVNPTTTTTYTVSATSTTGACVATAEFTVTVNALPVVEVAAAPTVICQNDMINLTATNVDGYSYNWSTGAETREATVAAATTGNYTVTVTDLNGCVNTFTTNNVTVNPVYELNDEQSACVGMLPVTWGTQNLTEAGSYDQTFQTINGCDSTVHLTFIVQDTANNNSYRELCEGATFTFGTGIYQQTYTATTSTVISYVDTTSGECPARYNLYLTVNTHNPATVENTVCDTYTWPLNNETYNVSGAYQTTLQTTKGCDSVVTLNLTVNYQNTGVDEQTACDSYEWIDGNTYTASNNTATYTLENMYGCDSVVTLNLTVNYRSYHEDFHRVCDSKTFTWDDNEVYDLDVAPADSIQYITGENSYGCLEIALLHLDLNYVSDTVRRTVNACDEYVIDTVACDNNTATAYLRESGIYTMRVHNDTLDRDEMLILDLTVNQSAHHTTIATGCLPYTWYVNRPDSTLFEVATITADMVNGASVYHTSVDLAEAGYVASSCSQIEVLRLTPKYPTEEVIEAVICQNGSWAAPQPYTYVVNGSDLNVGLNTRIYNLGAGDSNAANCPLVKKVELTVNPIYNETMELTFCETEFVNNTLTYANPNDTAQTIELTIPGALDETVYDSTVVANWQTALGCDSTVTINYTVYPTTTETYTVASCYEYTWGINGETYSESGEYTYVTTNDYGCSHTDILNLTINDTIRRIVDSVVCTRFEYQGTTYFNDMTFLDRVLPSEDACDTAVYIAFHVQQTELIHQYVVANRPYTWKNGQTFTQNVENVYYDEPGEGDCGNVYSLHLTMVDPITFCDDAFPYETGIGGITLTTDDVVIDTASFCGDNAYQYSIGRTSGNVLWGIKFVANRPTDYYNFYGAQLYYVNGYPGDYTLNVYAGGDNAPGTLIGTKTVTLTAGDETGWKYFQLDEPVNVDGQNLWVTFAAAEVSYPAAAVQYFDANDQNGAWVSGDYGVTWTSLNENNAELYNSFMIKAVYSANMWKNNDPQGNDTILYYTVNKTYNKSRAEVACDSYTWDGVTYNESGNYTNNYTSAEGCDSVYTINLTVNAHTDSVLTATACDSYSWAGNEFTATGDYVIDTNAAGEPLKNVAGCDSTATLHLTINVNNGVEQTLTACDSYTWNGQTFTTSGDQSVTFTDANGCTGDSVLHLTINNTVVANADSIVNAASTYYLGVLYEAPYDGYINDTLANGAANGCDSITRMHLQVNMGAIISEDTVSCGDFTWRDGNTYTWIPMAERTNPAFNYKNRTTNQPVEDFPVYETYDANGIVVNTYVLHLTMAEASVEYKDVTVLLSNDTYTDATNGHVFDFTAEKATGQNATKLDTLRLGSAYYCDSIVYYTFNLVYNYVDDDTVTVCNEVDSYTTANNNVIALAEGINVFTDTTAAGTDNEVVHNKVYVRSTAITGTETIVACDSTTWNNTLYTASVVDEQVVLTAANGCDSVVTLNITITNTIHNVVEPAGVCDSYTWADKDSTYLASTIDTWSRANATDAQCTDVDTLKLVVNYSNTGIDTQTACDTYTWIDGNTYTASNTTATHTLTNAVGCDSVVTLNLTINNSYDGPGRDIDTIGASITLTDNNGSYVYITPEGGYDSDTSLTFSTVAGCDSIVSFHLHISQYEIVAENPIECGIYTWNNAGHGTGHTYRWISNDEKTANAINIPGAAPMLPLYKDVTANAYVYSRPMDTVGSIVYMLNLNLNEAQFVDSTIARFPQSVNTMTLYGQTFDFTGMTSASQPTADTIVHLTLPHTTLCGTVKIYNVHVVYNYDTDAVTVCYTDTYTWEDNTTSAVTVGSGNTFTKTLFAGNWASEQVVTRTITVRPNNNTYSFDQEVCDSYTWNDSVYTTTGAYEQTFTDQNGCDSVATLNLTVKYNNNHGETVVACDSTQWNGEWYSVSGDYTYSYTHTNGCASVDTLHLTINHNVPQVTTESVCDSYTWTLNSREYNTSGNYTATRTDTNGCQAMDTLKLTVRKSTSYDSVMYVTDGSYRYTAQDGSTTLILAGNTGSFVEHYTNAAQCDSTLNITINVGEGYFAIDDTTNCNSYTWRDGNTYVWISAEERAANNNALYKNQTTGAYVMSNPIHRVANAGDYDSIFMLRLNLTQNYTEDVTINFPISLGTLTYGDSTFNFTVTNDEGREFVNTTVVREVHYASSYYCDSIHYLTINLQNNYSEVTADNADICVTQTSYTWRNQTISTATSDFDHVHIYYMYDTVGTAEAPVVEYIKLTQHPVVYATERRTACDSYTWNGTLFTESTSNATFDTVDMWGCDSTVTLMLTINHNSSTATIAVECDSYEWTANNAAHTVIGTYTQSGEYAYEYISDEGCPSTDSLFLTINSTTNNAYTVDECDSYTWNGMTLTTSCDTVFAYTNAAGCPSVDTLHLTIRYNSNETFDKTVCDTYTWTVAEGGNGETYTESGIYTYDYTAESNCPSTNTLNLTVNHNNGHTDVLVACDSIDWHGTMYYADITGVTFSYTDDNNCASIDTLALTVNHASHNVETVVACQTYTWHGNVITNPSSVGDMFYGTYEYTYTNGDNCTSVDTLHLTLGGGRTFGTEEVTWCGPYTWVVNGEEVGTLTESVETTTSFVNPRTGCDSVVFLYLTILDAPSANESATICDGLLPYTWRGKTFEAAGEDTVHVASEAANGCDSIIYFTLMVNPTYAIDLTADICLGSGYTGYGFDIPAEELPAVGEYTFVDNLTSMYGCDSVVTLTVTVKNFFTTTVEATACDSYTWELNGVTYDASGNYEHTIPAVNSCDSVITLALTIMNSTTGIDEQVACNRYTWIDGNTYTASNNTATFTLENTVGCDSVVTLNLTVNYSNNHEFTDVACDSYTWNGATYNQSGDYTYAGTNVDGCDSVVTLHLTINNSTASAVQAVACNSYEWTEGNGQTYTESGDYTYTTTAANGCDSVVTLTLTINTPVSSIEDVTVCESYEWNGVTYTESGTYTYDYVDDNNCDAVATLILTINTPEQSIETVTSCDSYSWNNRTYTNSGEYTDTYVDANGCIATATLELTINASTTSSELVTACGSYEWNGKTYRQTGIYTYSTFNAAGCDSTATLSLVINQSINTTESATACDSYEWNGTVYTESGVYTYTSTGVDGCDSTVALTLTVKNSNATTLMTTACESYTWHGQNYNESGVYTYTTTNVYGCDSVVTLNLTINNATQAAVEVTACSNYNWNGQTYNQTGVYSYTTTNVNGCDSVVTLNLTINNPVTETYDVTACGSYIWNGNTYQTSGNYTYTSTGVNGCDSTTVLNLTINQAATSSFSATECGSYTWNGTTYSQSGAYTQTFTTTDGCDSIVTLLLVIKSPVTSTVTVSACNSYSWNGTTYNVSGVFTQTFTNVEGCDSIVTLNLTVNHATAAAQTAQACESYTWHGTTYSQSGVYTYTTTNANGCDSVITLTLTINHATAGIDEQNACDSYTWINGVTYTASTNVPTFTTTNANGCDSVVTLHLTLGHSTLDTIYVTAEGSYTWNGCTYSVSGFYPYNGTNTMGCDSVVVLGLTVTPPTHVLTLVAKDTAGTMGIGGTVLGGGSYAEGETATLTATPDEGYTFYGWEINGAIVSTSNPYNYVMGTSDVTITGVFIDQTFYNVALMTATTAGQVNEGGTVNGGGLYLAGTHVTITAVPDEGYVFEGWYTTNDANPNGVLVTTYPIYSFDIDNDYVFLAVFASETDSAVVLTVQVDENMGRVLINNEEREGNIYQGTLGETVTLEAIANNGYVFAAWSDGDTNRVRNLVLDQNVVSIRAIFTRTTVGIDDVDDNEVEILTSETRIIVRGADQLPVYVYDVVGRLINHVDHAAPEQTFELNETGVYLVKVGNMAARRVVVRR